MKSYPRFQHYLDVVHGLFTVANGPPKLNIIPRQFPANSIIQQEFTGTGGLVCYGGSLVTEGVAVAVLQGNDDFDFLGGSWEYQARKSNVDL